MGSRTYLLSQQPKTKVFEDVLGRFDPTVLLATPSMYAQLVEDAAHMSFGRLLHRIRVCMAGGEGMPADLGNTVKSILDIDVIIGFGMAEVLQFALAGKCIELPLGSCGRPVPGVQVRLVDEEGRTVGANAMGHLEVKTKTLAKYYWNRSGQSLAALPIDDGWFRTKDRMLSDEGGNFFHCGRSDGLFKVGGKWVSPDEIEQSLLAHEAVWECAVIDAEDKTGFVHPVAFVVPNIGHSASVELAQELRAFVKKDLAPYKYPRNIQFVDRLPRGPSGKLLRYRLRVTEK